MTNKNMMVCFDTQSCLKCFACVIACGVENRVRLFRDKDYKIEKSATEALPYYNYITPQISEKGNFPDVSRVTALKHCMHCSNPQCEKICPTKAITKEVSGAIVINEDLCIGCRSCIDACPYDVPKFSEDTGRCYKCMMCDDRLKAGLQTACAAACPSVAIFSGNADEILAEAKKRAENYSEKFGKKYIVYGADEVNSHVGSLHYITIAPEENRDEFLLPENPRSYTATSRNILKVAGIVGGVGVAAAIGLHVNHWKKNKDNSPLHSKDEE